MIKISDIRTWEEWDKYLTNKERKMKMKICHCVKLTDEEVKAFRTVCEVLDEMDDDPLLTSNFNDYDVSFCDIRSWLDEVMDFIHNLNG